MAGFFAAQCVDDIGKQSTRLEKWILIVLGIYVVHIGLSFYLTTVYRTSLIGPIFSLAGLLVGIGILGSYKRDHTMTCVYIGVLAIELVLGIIGTALWVVEGVVISSTKLQVINGPNQRSKTALYISVILAATIPIAILVNLYCLVLAAKLKMALKDVRKQHRALAEEERVLLLVEEIVTQQLNMQHVPFPAPIKPLHSNQAHHSHSNHRSHSNQPHRTQKEKEKQSDPTQETQIEMSEYSGDSAM